MNNRKRLFHGPSVLITMRSEVNSNGTRVSCVENSWYDFLYEIFLRNTHVLLVPNFDVTAVEFLNTLSKPELVILSGGNDLAGLPNATNTDSYRDQVENMVLKVFPATPLLGVCRGFQLANRTLGGNTREVEKHVANNHKVQLVNQDSEGTFVTNSFHRWGIDHSELAEELTPLAVHQDSTIEAACHISNPWLFTMWHPERANPEDPQREWVIRSLRKLVSGVQL